MSCTSFNFLWASSCPTHLDKTLPGILQYDSLLTKAYSFSTFSTAVSFSFTRASLIGNRQSSLHCSSWNLSFKVLIIDSFLLPTSILVLPLLKIICKPNAANESMNQFSFLGECSILKVKKFSFIFWVIALYGARLGSFR